jgi:choline kinase
VTGAGEQSLTLVVLAAGLGSRFGGLKQLVPVGPAGETLMDYSLYDGWRAGFTRAVFVIRPDMQGAFDREIRERYRDHFEVSAVAQRLDDLPRGEIAPPGRTKPWGTAHATWTSRGLVRGPFAVLNADDFYGRRALERAAASLTHGDRHAVLGYRLGDTLSPVGGVNRAVLGRRGDGCLFRIVETRSIEAGGGGLHGRTPAGR